MVTNKADCRRQNFKKYMQFYKLDFSLILKNPMYPNKVLPK